MILFRTTAIRDGSEKKTPREQNSSGEKIGAESAVLHFVFFIVMVNKMQQSAKENCLLKRNTLPEWEHDKGDEHHEHTRFPR